MRREEIIFRAGISRLVLGALALWSLPALYPKMAAQRPVLVGYLVLAVIEQLLIRKQLGGRTRSLVFGAVDLCLITFLAHRVGSVGTPIVSLYFLAGVLNTLVVGLRVGIAQAVLASTAYAGVLLAEQLRLLPYAPDAVELEHLPTRLEAFAAFALTALILGVFTGTVGLMQRALEGREAELVKANDRLEQLSRHDPLTKLANRRHLLAKIDEGLAFVRRGRQLGLLMFDLDGFKRVNDTQGHLRGDMLLQEIGEAMRATTREIDVAARYGGDEFVILLFDTSESDAKLVAERVVRAVRAVGERFSTDRPVTASVGLAMALADDQAASLLRRADERAYIAKLAGGDRYVLAA